MGKEGKETKNGDERKKEGRREGKRVRMGRYIGNEEENV